MRIQSAEIFRYQLPLRKSLPLKNLVMENRSGILIRLMDDQQAESYGEVAPLPGWHPETLTEAEDQLLSILPQIVHQEFQENLPETFRKMDDLFIDPAVFSSVRWGMESAILQLILKRKGHHFAQLREEKFQKNIDINALLTTENQLLVEEAAEQLSQGYRTLKIKVGRQPIDAEAELLRRLGSVLNPAINIRLDANRSWTLSQALDFAEAIAGIPIEYLEEPLVRLDQLADFYERTGIPLALDESLNDKKPGEIQIPEGIKTLVIKPTRMGGISGFLRWLDFADDHRLDIVISSAFESGLTLAVLSELAAMLHPGNRAMGLQTFHWLAEDLIIPPFRAENGQIVVSEMMSPPFHIDESKLAILKRFL
jgi:O-succinylbenzoate synthase